MRIAIIGIESSHVDQFVQLLALSPEHELVGIGLITNPHLQIAESDVTRTRLAALGDIYLRSVPRGAGVDNGQLHANTPSHGESGSPRRMANHKWPSNIAIVQGTANEVAGSLAPFVDAVIIADRASKNHASQAEPFIRSGKHVFVDKPFTSTLDDARALVAAAQHSNVLLSSFSALRFAPEVVALALIAQGVCDQLKTQMLQNRTHSGPSLLVPEVLGLDDSHRLNTHHALEYANIQGSFSKDSPYGSDFYLVHCAEIAHTILGRPFSSVKATYRQGTLFATVTANHGDHEHVVHIEAFEESVHGYVAHAISLGDQQNVPIAMPPLYLEPGMDRWFSSISEGVLANDLPDSSMLLATIDLTMELINALP